ncbi:MAG TPA: AI-2E family transporter [Xanthobacteraceae bacterium]|jgi:predicted PurR-regulated permease PerM|nr:AI-2E family transporter [Xanthobacteraceae bacterium]
MAADPELKITAGIVAAVAVATATYLAASVFAPLVLALFIIAIVWPLQNWLQSRLPKLAALATTIIVTIAVCLVFASLAAWGFGRVGRALVADAARYQALYASLVTWLDSHGISVAGQLAEQFNVGWLLRAAQHITGRINTTLSFWIIALVYVVLGLLEVDDFRRKIATLDNRDAARVLLDGSAATAAKFRRYILVRTLMSAVTGLLVGCFAWITGLQFAVEWGVIAFVLNYIPFIGPFIATLFPTLLAMTQFESWQAVLGIFICLNIIQFVVGSYVEPRVSGSLLSISPFVVLFSVFFWTFLWGLFGSFIGVPITLAILTFCGQHPASRWLADLFGGPVRGELKEIEPRV